MLHRVVHGRSEDAGGGTEVSGGSCARQAIGFSAPVQGNPTTITNNADVNFGTATANWGTITHAGIFDAPSGGNLLAWGPLVNNATINNTDGYKFLAGHFVQSFD